MTKNYCFCVNRSGILCLIILRCATRDVSGNPELPHHLCSAAFLECPCRKTQRLPCGGHVKDDFIRDNQTAVCGVQRTTSMMSKISSCGARTCAWQAVEGSGHGTYSANGRQGNGEAFSSVVPDPWP